MCVNIGTECWCHHNRNTPGYAVCGYTDDYNGQYYSIAINSSHSAKTISEALDQQFRGGADCATNTCYTTGCTGSSLTCWSNQERWQRSSIAGIVRCKNLEGIFLSYVYTVPIDLCICYLYFIILNLT